MANERRNKRDSYTEEFAWKLCAAYQAQMLNISLRTAEENIKEQKADRTPSPFWYELADEVLGRCMEARNETYARMREASKGMPKKGSSSKKHNPSEFH